MELRPYVSALFKWWWLIALATILAGGMSYWLITTGPDSEPGINGGMSKREKEWAKNASMSAVTIGVENIDSAIEKVEKFGGKIIMPKNSIAGVGWFASFKDTEENELSLMQTDMSVK